VIFHGYVSLPEGINRQLSGWSTGMYMKHKKHCMDPHGFGLKWFDVLN
jgi:hypothetical protein